MEIEGSSTITLKAIDKLSKTIETLPYLESLKLLMQFYDENGIAMLKKEVMLEFFILRIQVLHKLERYHEVLRDCEFVEKHFDCRDLRILQWKVRSLFPIYEFDEALRILDSFEERFTSEQSEEKDSVMNIRGLIEKKRSQNKPYVKSYTRSAMRDVYTHFNTVLLSHMIENEIDWESVRKHLSSIAAHSIIQENTDRFGHKAILDYYDKFVSYNPYSVDLRELQQFLHSNPQFEKLREFVDNLQLKDLNRKKEFKNDSVFHCRWNLYHGTDLLFEFSYYGRYYEKWDEVHFCKDLYVIENSKRLLIYHESPYNRSRCYPEKLQTIVDQYKLNGIDANDLFYVVIGSCSSTFHECSSVSGYQLYKTPDKTSQPVVTVEIQNGRKHQFTSYAHYHHFLTLLRKRRNQIQFSDNDKVIFHPNFPRYLDKISMVRIPVDKSEEQFLCDYVHKRKLEKTQLSLQRQLQQQSETGENPKSSIFYISVLENAKRKLKREAT